MTRDDTGHFTGQNGLKLFYRTWLPSSPHQSIVLVHGMNEHMGRYVSMARYLAERGFAVFGLDQRGHGQSEGVRCHVNRFDEYGQDLKRFIDEVVSPYGKPIMIGHSMGGLISFRYSVAYPDTLRALVLSSPLFKNRVQLSPVLKLMLPVMSALLPRLQVPVPFKPEDVCRDPEIIAGYAHDKLVGKTGTPRWTTEFFKAAAACHQGLAGQMKLPVLFLQAGEDRLVEPEATRAIFHQVPHDRKTFKLYPEMFHEIFNEPGKEGVYEDILQWLRQQELVPSL